MGELDGKVAIVTGAGRLRGIGRASAVALAKLGADVVVTGTGRDPNTFPPDEKEIGWRDIESTVEQVESEGQRALGVIGDVSNGADVDRMVQETVDHFGRVDILVNNAAFARGPDRVPVHELTEEMFRRVIDIKLVGSFLFSKAVGVHLMEQDEGGRIVNLSSVAGKRGSADAAAYNAANASVIMLAQSVAAWLAPYNVTVNAVCPGITDTSRMDDLGYPRGDTWERSMANNPLGRAASDDEIAGVIAWLCSEPAGYISGQAINVNGGSVTW